MTIIALPVLLLALLVPVGALVSLIVLLSNPRTRTATLVVLAVLSLPMVAMVCFALLGVRHVAHVSSSMQELSYPRHTVARAVPPQFVPPPAQIEVEQSDAAPQHPPAVQTGRLVRGLGQALSKAITGKRMGHSNTAPVKLAMQVEKADPPRTTSGATAGSSSSAEPPPNAGTAGQASSGAQAANPAAGRPAWVDAPAGRDGDLYRMTVCIGPYTTRAECDARLPQALQNALTQYTEIYLGAEAAGRVEMPAGELEPAILRGQYEETIQASVGPMIQLHLLLEFDRSMQSRIKDCWHQALVTGRLWLAGTGLLALLALLAVAVGYLKADLATAGAYRGRLRLAAMLAALAVAGGAYGAWQKIGTPTRGSHLHTAALETAADVPPVETISSTTHGMGSAAFHLGTGRGSIGGMTVVKLAGMALLLVLIVLIVAATAKKAGLVGVLLLGLVLVGVAALLVFAWLG
jgi:hypothetical protein